MNAKTLIEDPVTEATPVDDEQPGNINNAGIPATDDQTTHNTAAGETHSNTAATDSVAAPFVAREPLREPLEAKVTNAKGEPVLEAGKSERQSKYDTKQPHGSSRR